MEADRGKREVRVSSLAHGGALVRWLALRGQKLRGHVHVCGDDDRLW